MCSLYLETFFLWKYQLVHLATSYYKSMQDITLAFVFASLRIRTGKPLYKHLKRQVTHVKIQFPFSGSW